MENFGRCLGTIIQISDDIEDLGQNPHHDDRKPILSPLANAYRAHISAYQGASRSPSSYDQPETPPLNNSLILYLRLESLKYAELARNELNTIQLALGPREQILAILNHLSWLGASVN
jgi:geranylgeranyl pyrophosphate synthase